MTNPINTFQDILDAMEQDPSLGDALRRHILTDALMQLPVQFRVFMEAALQMRDSITRLEEGQDALRKDARELNTRMSNVETRLTRIEGDFGTTKGYYARNTAAADVAGIAQDMGAQLVRTLTNDDLSQLAGNQLDTATGRSFRSADLVMETVRDGTTQYVALEVSYTADHRDSDRAIRNAALLTKFTGRKTTAGVASVRNSREVQELVNSRALYWHPLEDRTPVPE